MEAALHGRYVACVSHTVNQAPLCCVVRVCCFGERAVLLVPQRDLRLSLSVWFCQLAYYYNSALKASRYSNSNGQFTFACQGFDTQPASSACDMINAPDGHLYILFPTTE